MKGQLNSDEKPPILKSPEFQKLRTKLEKSTHIETPDIMKAREMKHSERPSVLKLSDTFFF